MEKKEKLQYCVLCHKEVLEIDDNLRMGYVHDACVERDYWLRCHCKVGDRVMIIETNMIGTITHIAKGDYGISPQYLVTSDSDKNIVIPAFPEEIMILENKEPKQ